MERAATAQRGRIVVGTTSWTEKTLLKLGRFYPDHVKTAEERLRYYASVFPIVEVDSTYYAIAAERHATHWVERTTPAFTFDLKAYRLFTGHKTPVRSLPADVQRALGTRDTNIYYAKVPAELQLELWRRFRASIEPLHGAGRLGVVLFQLAHWLIFGKEGMRHIAHCAEQMEGFRLAVELRHSSWLREARRERTLSFLRDHGIAHVVVDEPQAGRFCVPAVWAATRDDVAVLRLHGRNRDTWQRPALAGAERLAYHYEDEELRDLVSSVKRLAKQASEVHVLFNNCFADHAQTNALRFTELLGGRGAPRARSGGQLGRTAAR